MRVVVTGAAGLIGQEIIRELADTHELTMVDRRPVTGPRSFIIDLAQCDRHHGDVSSNPSEWQAVFAGADVVVHLAEESNPNASSQQVFHNNMHATWNVIHAAAEHNVKRVVYASSNWAVKLLEEQLAPDCYTEGGLKITSEAHQYPKQFYGMGKAFGELAGKCYVDNMLLEAFLAVRIGWFEPSCPKDALYQHLKITTRDLRSFFRRCVEAPFTGSHIVYAVSAQKSAPYDSSYTHRLLGWKPSAE